MYKLYLRQDGSVLDKGELAYIMSVIGVLEGKSKRDIYFSELQQKYIIRRAK